jgi:hypothetical protein
MPPDGPEKPQERALDGLAGRRFNAPNGRIASAWMLYRADGVLRMEPPASIPAVPPRPAAAPLSIPLANARRG